MEPERLPRPDRPGLLAVWNDIAAQDEPEFNAWYVEEHVPERLGVPGVLGARRYRDTESPLRYAALYDTDTVAVLSSEPYLERLANPSARTRAIMPRFRNMSRAACEIGVDVGPLRAPGAVLAVIELADSPSDGAIAALEAHAGRGRARLALPDANATQVPNPEAAMRGAPDRLPAPFVLLEGHDESALRDAAGRLAQALGAPRRPRVFRLILARGA